MSAQGTNKTQAQIKAEKRAAALRDNLKKRKALSQNREKENAKDENGQ